MVKIGPTIRQTAILNILGTVRELGRIRYENQANRKRTTMTYDISEYENQVELGKLGKQENQNQANRKADNDDV